MISRSRRYARGLLRLRTATCLGLRRTFGVDHDRRPGDTQRRVAGGIVVTDAVVAKYLLSTGTDPRCHHKQVHRRIDAMEQSGFASRHQFGFTRRDAPFDLTRHHDWFAAVRRYEPHHEIHLSIRTSVHGVHGDGQSGPSSARSASTPRSGSSRTIRFLSLTVTSVVQ